MEEEMKRQQKVKGIKEEGKFKLSVPGDMTTDVSTCCKLGVDRPSYLPT